MSSDDIEYHIKFPSNCTNQFSPNSEDGFIHVRKTHKCPVVFLLGWIGCKDKNLARYSDVYEEKGCITVRCCVPLSVLMFHHYRYPNLAGKLLDLIVDMNLDEHPIFFHVFSNGGCYLYQYIVNELQLRNYQFDFCGCIIDSAPGMMRNSSVFKTIMGMPISVKPIRSIFAIFACIWMYLLNIGMLLLRYFVGKRYLSGDVYTNLLAAPSDIPYLFIYSSDDKFVQVKDIDQFVTQRKALGTSVETCRFDSSPHVMHLLTHREKYVDFINCFLQESIRKSSPSSC